MGTGKSLLRRPVWLVLIVLCALYACQVTVALYYSLVPVRTILFEPQHIRVDAYRGEGFAFTALPLIGLLAMGDTYVCATPSPGVYTDDESEVMDYTFDANLDQGDVSIREKGRLVEVCTLGERRAYFFKKEIGK